MKSVLIALLLGAGCLPVAKECAHPCFKSVSAGFETSCARFSKNVETVKSIFDDNGIIPAKDFCDAFKGTNVYFRSDGSFFYVAGDRATGVSYWPAEIELTRDGLSFAHELLHIWDDIALDVSDKDNAAHKDWAVKGYYKATFEYWTRAYSMAPEHFADEPLDKPLSN